jgi:beta-galactosidase
VIIWSLGNESGHGANHDALYRWIKSVDPSARYSEAARAHTFAMILFADGTRVDRKMAATAVPKWSIKKWLSLPGGTRR